MWRALILLLLCLPAHAADRYIGERVDVSDVSGLGTIATQDATGIAVTGGTIEGLTRLGIVRTEVSSLPYSVLTTDVFLSVTGTGTVNLPSASTFSGRLLWVKNAGTGIVTLDGNEAETIDGAATDILNAGHTAALYCTGTVWQSLGTPSITAHLELPLNNFRKGSTSPANSSTGTTPEIPYMAFAATNERVGFILTMPDDWNYRSDLELHLNVILLGAETAGDVIGWSCDYVVVRSSNADIANGDGGAVTKTSSTTTGSGTIVAGTGNAGLAAGVEYHVVLTFDRNDASNPYMSYPSTIYGEIYRTAVGGAGQAGSVGLTGGHFHYTRVD